ncbi:MAG TPA: hypothetical protein VMS31_08440, partial [Pyrinomonadaceae bacterium]|nr:hypothetical protein [Pyrinomonadaceae bacterium]
AGRGELFAQMFSVSADHQVTETDAAAHLSPGKLMEKYGTQENVLWTGPGAHLQRELLADHAKHNGFAWVDDSTDPPNSAGQLDSPGWRLAAKETNLARHAAALALLLFERGEVQSADTIQAIYVRPSDAELNQQCR